MLAERLPQVTVMTSDAAGFVGKNSVRENLTAMLIEIAQLFDASLPIAMSVFSDPELLARDAEAIQARGGPGPGFIIQRISEYLQGEQAAGRVSTTAPVGAAATALVGACMHHAFSSFYDHRHGEDRDKDFAALADSVVTAILHGVCPD